MLWRDCSPNGGCARAIHIVRWTPFQIVTTEANELTFPIHDRMPVILHPRDYDRWLNDYDPSRPPLDLLRPFESEGMRMTPANRSVGNVCNNGPEMLNSA